jgi:hypothetical protein
MAAARMRIRLRERLNGGRPSALERDQVNRRAGGDDLADHKGIQLPNGGREPFVSILIRLGGAGGAGPPFFGRKLSPNVHQNRGEFFGGIRHVPVAGLKIDAQRTVKVFACRSGIRRPGSHFFDVY